MGHDPRHVDDYLGAAYSHFMLSSIEFAAMVSLALQASIGEPQHGDGGQRLRADLPHSFQQASAAPAENQPDRKWLKYPLVGAALGGGVGIVAGYWTSSPEVCTAESGCHSDRYTWEGALLGMTLGAATGLLVAATD